MSFKVEQSLKRILAAFGQLAAASGQPTLRATSSCIRAVTAIKRLALGWHQVDALAARSMQDKSALQPRAGCR